MFIMWCELNMGLEAIFWVLSGMRHRRAVLSEIAGCDLTNGVGVGVQDMGHTGQYGTRAQRGRSRKSQCPES